MQNGKHAVIREAIDGIGFASTEFHVIRPRDLVLPEWIHLFLIQPWLLHEATEHFSGSVGQQRLPESYLASIKLPLPPLDEQRRIAARLQEQLGLVERARQAANEQLEALEAMQSSVLRKAFEVSSSRDT